MVSFSDRLVEGFEPPQGSDGAGDDTVFRFSDGRGIAILEPRSMVLASLVAVIGADEDLGPVTAVRGIGDLLGHVQDGRVFDAVVLHCDTTDAGSMHGLSSLIRSVQAVTPTSAVVVLGADGEPRSAVRAFEIGVRGYLTADTRVDYVIDAIKFIREGWTVFSPFIPPYPARQ